MYLFSEYWLFKFKSNVKKNQYNPQQIGHPKFDEQCISLKKPLSYLKKNYIYLFNSQWSKQKIDQSEILEYIIQNLSILLGLKLNRIFRLGQVRLKTLLYIEAPMVFFVKRTDTHPSLLFPFLLKIKGSN